MPALSRFTRAGFAPLLVAASGIALFTCMDAVMKQLTLDHGVYLAMLWRGWAGAAMGAAVYAARRRRRPAAQVLRLHVRRAVVVAAMALAWFWGIARLPLAEALAISFISPVVALFLAGALLGERVGREAIGASLLGLAGVAVILAGRLGGQAHSLEAAWGAASVLLSACLYGYNLVLARSQAMAAGPAEISFFQNAVVAAIFTLPLPWIGAVPPLSAWPLIILGAGLALISLLLMSWAYARAEAQRLIPIEYTGFVWAVILGWLVFAEPVTLLTLAGTVLIVTGSVVAARARPDLERPGEIGG